ncbi:MAG: DUF3078 domain-containing protein [Bacteroidaceae bacterium]|jgi:hypothetical protein|nr:DUF3078 domain-containing protein [Bacteroidaceae bacterium]
MMKKLILFIILSVSISFGFAQKKKPKSFSTYTESIIKKYSDSLSVLKNYYDSTWTYNNKDILGNPYYSHLFFQPTLYNSPINQVMDNNWIGKYNRESQNYSLMDIRDDELQRDSAINRFFSDFYVTNPSLINVTEEQVESNEGIRQEVISAPIKHEVSIADRIKPTEPVEVVEPLKVISHRPNFWSFASNLTLQYMQNYTSSNWFQNNAKENNNTMLATTHLEADYNFNSKVIFLNSLDVKLGFLTVRSDSVHHFHTNTDDLRMTNKLNIRSIIKNWSYSLQLQSWTQMLPKYNDNSHHVYSDFLSPFESALSVGMEYNWRKNRFSISANIGALAFDFKYVDRANLETNNGLPDRHHFREYYGSNVTIRTNWQIFKELNWNGRLYYFTNYQKVQVEWENTFSFAINKYLSTNLYFYPRFDDSQFDSNHNHRMQLKQNLSIGFSHSF